MAARASVGKATTYRRWSSKHDLVAEAVATLTFSSSPIVETGDVRADLLRVLRDALADMRSLPGQLMLASWEGRNGNAGNKTVRAELA